MTLDITQYVPLTTENRIQDMVLPEYIQLNNTLVPIPKSLLEKDPHFLLDIDGNPIRAAWISKPLGYILNYFRVENLDLKERELQRAIAAVDEKISSLIKFGVLQDKRGPGAMSFSQSHENVPKDAIVISKRTYQILCSKNQKWTNARSVMVIRFPNLGPSTTLKLKLIVNQEEFIPFTGSLIERVPNIKDLLELFETDEESEPTEDFLDSFYLNPETLKDCLQGDGDGDIIYMVLEETGHVKNQEIDLTRTPGEIKQKDIETLFAKADRCDRTDLVSWLPPYFDDVPIGHATYVIRWMLNCLLHKYKDTDHPMHYAWLELAPFAIELIEFVMDIRKGDWTEQQISQKMGFINKKIKEIRKAQKEGDWFALTVTNSTVGNIPSFIVTFPKIQSFVDSITKQNNLQAHD